MDKLPISVVIPSFNSSQTILGCIDSLLVPGEPLPDEVIVVDSGTDGSGELVSACFPQVRVHKSAMRLLPGAARNLGWQRARNQVVAFLDSDCLACEGWLAAIFDAHSTGETAGITGSFEPDNPEDLWGFLVFCAELAGSLPGQAPGPSRLAPSGNTSYRRQILERFGGFPEEGWCEDTILAKTIRDAGETILLDPAVKVKHINRTGFGNFVAAFDRSGYYSAKARYRHRLRGHFVARFPLFVPFLLPYRLLSILWINARGRNPQWIRLALLSPALIMGLGIWCRGFWKGARAARGESDRRPR